MSPRDPRSIWSDLLRIQMATTVTIGPPIVKQAMANHRRRSSRLVFTDRTSRTLPTTSAAIRRHPMSTRDTPPQACQLG